MVMELNPDKCGVFRISRKRMATIYTYTIPGTPLKTTDTVKYLGITVSKDMNWFQHALKASHRKQAAFSNTLRFIQKHKNTQQKDPRNSIHHIRQTETGIPLLSLATMARHKYFVTKKKYKEQQHDD